MFYLKIIVSSCLILALACSPSSVKIAPVKCSPKPTTVSLCASPKRTSTRSFTRFVAQTCTSGFTDHHHLFLRVWYFAPKDINNFTSRLITAATPLSAWHLFWFLVLSCSRHVSLGADFMHVAYRVVRLQFPVWYKGKLFSNVIMSWKHLWFY